MTKTAQKLWLCLVEHKVAPGTVPVLFYAPIEPIDKAVKARFKELATARELTVVGKFDLSHALADDPVSKKAIAAFIAGGGMDS